MAEYLSLNGESIGPDTLEQWRCGRCGREAELGDFLAEWYSEADFVTLHTSGSTGKPQRIQAAKEAMRASARLSCEYFGIIPGTRALLCLPLRYIAGKMMVVRALVSGCELLLGEPSSRPLATWHEPIDFAPLVPMQAAATLQEPGGLAQLAQVKTILLGGSFIDPALTEALQAVPSRIFASYGMTETLSHIALRHVNGSLRSEWYTPLRGISLSLSADGTLQIEAPHIGISRLTTNDLAEIAADGRFRILGRRDSVINSGGVKVQAEEVEQTLTAATGLPLLVVPAPHAILGQCVALLWEGALNKEPVLMKAIDSLPAYHRPRIIRHIDALPRTATGKLSRAQAAAMLR